MKGPGRMAPSIPYILESVGWPTRGRQSDSGAAVIAAAHAAARHVAAEQLPPGSLGAVPTHRRTMTLALSAREAGWQWAALELASTLCQLQADDVLRQFQGGVYSDAIRMWTELYRELEVGSV